MVDRKTLDDIRRLAATATVDHCYWVDAFEPSYDFCYDCARRLVAALHECGNSDAFVDGGSWANLESDGCRHCHTCGMLLEYYLTERGMEFERQHFEENGVGIPVTPDEAYHLVALEDAMLAAGDKWTATHNA